MFLMLILLHAKIVAATCISQSKTIQLQVLWWVEHRVLNTLNWLQNYLVNVLFFIGSPIVGACVKFVMATFWNFFD